MPAAAGTGTGRGLFALRRDPVSFSGKETGERNRQRGPISRRSPLDSLPDDQGGCGPHWIPQGSRWTGDEGRGTGDIFQRTKGMVLFDPSGKSSMKQGVNGNRSRVPVNSRRSIPLRREKEEQQSDMQFSRRLRKPRKRNERSLLRRYGQSSASGGMKSASAGV